MTVEEIKQEEIKQEEPKTKNIPDIKESSVSFSEDTENTDNTWYSKQKNKITEALENKFSWDKYETARQELSTIFETIKVYWEEKISNYITNNLPKKWINDIVQDPQKEKIIIDMFEQYLRKEWIETNIPTYSKLEQNNSKLEENNSKLEQDDSKLTKKIELSEENKNLLEQTEKDYNQLLQDKPNLKPSEKEINDQRSALEKDWTLNKLSQQWLSKDQINNYVSFNYTYTNHKEELKDTEFWKSYERLQDSLFPKEKLRSMNSFTWSTAIKETNDLIKSKPTINTYVQAIKTEKNESNEVFETKRETISKLEKPEEINKEFEKKEYQDLFKKYASLLPKQPEENNEQKQWERKKNAMLQMKDIEQNTQNILQQRIFGSAVSGLASYFNFSTAQKEAIGNDFKIDNDFDIKDSIFSLKGKINGKDINVAYDLWNGNLSVEDHLFQEKGQSVLRVWENKPQDLKIQLPSIDDLKDNAQAFLNKETISWKNPKEYLGNLEKGLHEELVSNFRGNQEIVKVRLERAVQKNLAVQETLKGFNNIISPNGKDLFSNKNFWEETADKNLFKLLQTVDNSLESYSISQIEERRDNMKKMTSFVSKAIYNPDEKDNQIVKTFSEKFSNKDEKNDDENQKAKIEQLNTIITSLTETKDTKAILNLEKFKKINTELAKAEPDGKEIKTMLPTFVPENFADNIIDPNRKERSNEIK